METPKTPPVLSPEEAAAELQRPADRKGKPDEKGT